MKRQALRNHVVTRACGSTTRHPTDVAFWNCVAGGTSRANLAPKISRRCLECVEPTIALMSHCLPCFSVMSGELHRLRNTMQDTCTLCAQAEKHQAECYWLCTRVHRLQSTMQHLLRLRRSSRRRQRACGDLRNAGGAAGAACRSPSIECGAV